MGIDSVQRNQKALPSHDHHISDVYMQRPGPQAIAQPTPSRKEQQMYSLPYSHSPIVHLQLNQPFRYPPREVFTPIEPQQQHGVRSRSASRTSVTAMQNGVEHLTSPEPAGKRGGSTKPWPQEPNTAYPASLPMRPENFQMPPPPLQLSPQADMWNMQALRSHVEQYFSNQTYSDCVLYIEEGFIGGVNHRFPGHKMLLSRSQMLFELISASDASNSSSSPTQLHIRLDETYVRIRPFLDSLKFIYGGSLPQANPLRHAGFDSESMAVNRSRMEDAMTYIATGSWLKMPVVATRGVEVATCLLNWDTVTIALSFALEGGLSQVWSQYDDVSEDKGLSSSRDASLAQDIRPPKYEPYSTTFLQRIVHSIVQMLPLNFYLDASAPQLEAVPRLPTLPLTHASRPSQSDPRLSKIRFGEVPIEDLQRPSYITTTSSSILLSLPFPVLKFLLEHPELAARLGPETVASIMRQVVAEREFRRTKVMSARVSSSNGDTDLQLMQNLHCAEVVEPSLYHRAGFRLARKRKNLDMPSSSGTETIRS
nr:hypothetical protein CFP56_21948 [Quercus suber]